MNSEHTAIGIARQRAREKDRATFVVFSKDENDKPGNDYHIAYESDLDTWYAGCPIVWASEDE